MFYDNREQIIVNHFQLIKMERQKLAKLIQK